MNKLNVALAGLNGAKSNLEGELARHDVAAATDTFPQDLSQRIKRCLDTTVDKIKKVEIERTGLLEHLGKIIDELTCLQAAQRSGVSCIDLEIRWPTGVETEAQPQGERK